MDQESNGWEGLNIATEQEQRLDGLISSRAEVAQAFARCFATSPGRLVLDHLRAITIERNLGPNTSEALLRHAEGQRQLVLHIMTLITKGREGA
ncbi:MAG: hypothetical protein H6905_06715 [Hyphomicrobiales bacterium]|nr:hypothetical protein [Hyphomicrobiales bacterium]